MLWCSDFCKWVCSSGLFLFVKASFWGISRDLAYFAAASSDCYFKLPSPRREADIIRRINNSASEPPCLHLNAYVSIWMNGSQNSRRHFLPRCPQYWRPPATFQNTHTIKSADDRSVGGLISCTDETEYRIEVEQPGGTDAEPASSALKWNEKLFRSTSPPCPALEDLLRNLCSWSFIDPFSCIVGNICQSACLFKSYLWSTKMTVTVTVS